MPRMGVSDQIKKAFQDIVVPEIHELRDEIRRLVQKVERLAARLADRPQLTIANVRSMFAARPVRHGRYSP